MKPISKKTVLVAVLAISTTLFSFSSLPGGDVFEIYVNKKLVVQQHIAQMTDAKSISLNKANYNDKIDVWYGHCGLTGKSRKLIIKDSRDHVLKQLGYADAADNKRSIMSFTANYILDLKKDNGNTFNLYYYSKELAKEKLLASVSLTN